MILKNIMMITTAQFFGLTGAILALFFALLLATSKRRHQSSDQFLIYFLIVFSLLILRINGLLSITLLEELVEYMRIEYLFSPLLYFYVNANLKIVTRRNQLVLLLLPFLSFSVFHSTMRLLDGLLPIIFDNALEIIEPFEVYLICFFNLSVLNLILKKVRTNNHKASFNQWIQKIVLGLMGILLAYLAAECLELWLDLDGWAYLEMSISLFLILMAYFGVQRLQNIAEQKNILKSNNKKKRLTPNHHLDANGNRFEEINRLMRQEALFKNANFDRNALGKHLGLSVSSVTRILKEEGQVSFNDFINQHRIDLAKEMLQAEKFQLFSLEAIGQEVGFKARSTFYQTFKKEVGISPGMYKKRYQMS